MRTALVGDGEFLLTGLFGRRTFEVSNVPRGWYLKAVRYRDKDITDVPTEFKAGGDRSALELVFSTRGAMVSGRVVNEAGEAVSRGRVVVFPADSRLWGSYRVAGVAISKDGSFEIGPMRGGDYLIVAHDPAVMPARLDERDQLARLAKAAERVVLRDEAHQTIDLRAVTRD